LVQEKYRGEKAYDRRQGLIIIIIIIIICVSGIQTHALQADIEGFLFLLLV